MDRIEELAKVMLSIEERLMAVENWRSDVFNANARYYATRDTARAEAMHLVIDGIVDKLLDALKEAHQ